MKYFILFLFIILPILLYSNDVYTSSINIRKINPDTVGIKWKSNEESGKFILYRNDREPITSIEILENSKTIAIIESEGILDRNIYKYPEYIDTIDRSGNFYYIILPFKIEYQTDDFRVNLNLTLTPVSFEFQESVLDNASPVTPTFYESNSELNVKDIFAKIIGEKVAVIWDISKNLTTQNDDYFFEVYKTTGFITNEDQIDKLVPYKSLYNEFYLEDFLIDINVPYYYTIIVNSNYTVVSGENSLLKPVVFNGRDIEVVVEREYYYTNISEIIFRDRNDEVNSTGIDDIIDVFEYNERNNLNENLINRDNSVTIYAEDFDDFLTIGVVEVIEEIEVLEIIEIIPMDE